MDLVKRESALWSYLTSDLRELIEDGERLVVYITREDQKGDISDFSFAVFPFAKAYEGFLKKLFFDLGMISHEDYYGDEIRIGRILNPRYIKEHSSVAKRMFGHSQARKALSEELWETWRIGRNRVFHYFPHNFRKLSYEEAMDIVYEIVRSMTKAVDMCDIEVTSLADIKKVK